MGITIKHSNIRYVSDIKPFKYCIRLYQLLLLLGCVFSLNIYASQNDIAVQAEASAEEELITSLEGLNSSSMKNKEIIIEDLIANNDENLKSLKLEWLNYILNGELFSNQNDFFLQKEINGQRQLVLVKDQASIVDNPGRVRKIIVNNKIRSSIKQYLASMDLYSNDLEIRKQAILRLNDDFDGQTINELKNLAIAETDSSLKNLLGTYLSKATLLTDIDTNINPQQAILHLSNNASPQTLEILKTFQSSTQDIELAELSQSASKRVENKLSLYKGIETFTFGLSLGSVLVLAAIGLAITFGVMGVINMAHGELIMIGAYCAYLTQQWFPNLLEWSVLIAIPFAFVVSGVVGICIERLVVKHLYGRPLETLLATFGISLILQQAVRSIFSPLNKMVQTPTWMSGSWQVSANLSLTWNRIYIIFFSLLCFALLYMIMKKTRLGLEVRAVSQNREMSKAMGINDAKVDMMTFGLGSAVAGVAGVALSQLTNVGPNLGQSYIVDSFMVVVVGGVGNLWGTLLSGLSLGVLNKLFEPWFGAVLAKAILLIIIIFFIQKFPRGMFPQKGRAVDG